MTLHNHIFGAYALHNALCQIGVDLHFLCMASAMAALFLKYSPTCALTKIPEEPRVAISRVAAFQTL